MNPGYHQYLYRRAELQAIPAIHHHSAFASQVHGICKHPLIRPEAIAVELGQNMVDELVRFLRFLNQGGNEKVQLPCMLGIMKRNYYLPGSCFEKALQLQKLYQMQLYDLPDDVLAEHLNFSKWSALYLSPADSIIEAIRCAMELGIPVYGVDLRDFARIEQEHHLIEDPHSAHDNPVDYCNRVMNYCSVGKDPQTDLNREIYMAARLKFCLAQHSRVLFTCGMAHWRSIKIYLDNPEILPFPGHLTPADNELKRVIIHPSLAARVMEVVPQVTFDYENNRRPLTDLEGTPRHVNHQALVRSCLDDAYEEYNSSLTSDKSESHLSPCWSEIAAFEQFIFQLASVRQRRIPDASTLLSSAEAMLDNDFCRLLSRKLMDVKPGWASPKDFPDLQVLEPLPDKNVASFQKGARRKVRVSSGQSDQGRFNDKNEESFYSNLPEKQDTNTPDIQRYWSWDQLTKGTDISHYAGNPWIYPSCENLLYGIGFKALELSTLDFKKSKYPEPFDGDFQNGIHVKATIKSIIRNERKIYVSGCISNQEQTIFDGIDPDPFVFIWTEPTDKSSCKWSLLQAGGDSVQIYVKNKDLYQRITAERGNCFVPSIFFEEKIAPPDHLETLVTSMTRIYGATCFGNPCINARQSSKWLEATGYRCCPIIREAHLSCLMDYYSTTHHIEFNSERWQESLILMAIPFAKKFVTLIAPDGFHTPERARIAAAAKGIALNIASLSNFSSEHIKEAQTRISIRTEDRAGMIFPEEAEILLGSKDKYSELLPVEMRRQLLTN